MHLLPIDPRVCKLTISHALDRVDSSYHLENIITYSSTDEWHALLGGGGGVVADDVIALDYRYHG